MQYKKGERLLLLAKEEWGMGEVLEDSAGGKVSIFFAHGGRRTLSTELARLQRATVADASNALLDNLIVRDHVAARFQSLAQSTERFLVLFPEGFAGADFASAERDYKVKAHKLAHELLNEVQFQSLLSARAYQEICKRALQIANATNLIFPNEKMALKDGLRTEVLQERFAQSLYNMVYGSGDVEPRFMAFSSALEEAEAAKWTIASYFPFIFDPQRYMFVKPTITQHAAELCGFEINYRPQLNELTLTGVLKFSDYLFRELAPLRPRDYIDVQSFMWCIAPGYAR